MNAFYVPAMAGMIYAMPGMETQLHGVLNKTGTFEGLSTNFSGDGFAGMHFRVASLSAADFDKWVAKVKADGGALDRNTYLDLERPSQNVPPRTFGTVDTSLFKLAVNQCVEPGKMCLDEMMAIDAKGGLGLAGINNVMPLVYDKYARRGSGQMRAYVAALCQRSSTSETAAGTADLAHQIKAPVQLSPSQSPPPNSPLKVSYAKNEPNPSARNLWPPEPRIRSPITSPSWSGRSSASRSAASPFSARSPISAPGAISGRNGSPASITSASA